MSVNRSLTLMVNGEAAPRRIAVGAGGATLGRAADCTVALPDGQRAISRVQARIEWREGACVLVDLGSNPTLVNARVLDASREAVLRDGDRITIGAYSIDVAFEGAEDVLAGASAGHDAQRPADAFALPLSSGDTAAEYMRKAPERQPRASPAMQPPGAATPADAPLIPPLIPPDWDADPEPPRNVAQNALQNAPQGDARFLPDPLAAVPLLRDAPPSGIDANQALIAALGSGDGPLGMPRPAVSSREGQSAFDHLSPERAFSAMPQMKSAPAQPASAAPPRPQAFIPDDYDALASHAQAAPDHADTVEVRAAGKTAADGPGPQAQFTAVEPSSPAAFGEGMQGAIRGPSRKASVERSPQADDEGAHETRQEPPHETSEAVWPQAPQHPVDAAPEPSFAPSQPHVAATPQEPPAKAARDGSANANANTNTTATLDPVLAALLEGLGLDPRQVDPRPAPELARLIGAMLREATQGAMTALRSRSTAKHETRIAMTMIESRDNNPLKFFPDAGSALAQMLGRPSAGYLAPEEALRGAFRDLQAHELAVLAGMRAALAHALADIAPGRIEQKLPPAGRLEAVLSNRHARLWNQFVATWEDTLRHAGDDFQQVFGEPFSRAYQAQLDALSGALNEPER